MGRRRDHYPRFDTTPCPDPEACARLYHGLGGPDGGDTCECCGSTIDDEIVRQFSCIHGVEPDGWCAQCDPEESARYLDLLDGGA